MAMLLNWLRFILFPLACLYDGLTRLRNRLYDAKLKKSHSFPRLLLVSVGNLSVGGTGKSPLVEYVVRLLQAQNKTVATLSRGYGRKTRGFLQAIPQSQAQDIGDEPLQFYQKFYPHLPVFVGEKRAEALAKIALQMPAVDTVVLDDAFQHRAVRPDVNILVTTFASPFFADWLLPTGTLRESRSEANRADLVVVSKCPPTLTTEQKNTYLRQIYRYCSPNTPVFFCQIDYLPLQPVFNQTPAAPALLPKQHGIILLTGIAQSTPLVTYISQQATLLKHYAFADHHAFSESEIEAVCHYYDSQSAPTLTLCTDKDKVRLQHKLFEKIIGKRPCYYVPIGLEFFEGNTAFDLCLLAIINQKKKDE